MKNVTFLRRILIIIVIFASNPRAFAQEHSILGSFFAKEINGKALLNWHIKAGSSCNGIQIFRSTDSIHFSQIWDIQGVCGNISEPQNYNFTDNNPVKNKVNYYRLELGNTGFSHVVSVEVTDINNGAYQIRPNPVNSEFKIYFDNDKAQEQQLIIYNMSGVQVFSSFTNENIFLLDAGILPSGLFLFTISTPENLPTLHGKLIVQH